MPPKLYLCTWKKEQFQKIRCDELGCVDSNINKEVTLNRVITGQHPTLTWTSGLLLTVFHRGRVRSTTRQNRAVHTRHTQRAMVGVFVCVRLRPIVCRLKRASMWFLMCLALSTSMVWKRMWRYCSRCVRYCLFSISIL